MLRVEPGCDGRFGSSLWIALGPGSKTSDRSHICVEITKPSIDWNIFGHMQLLDYVFVCSLNVVFVSLFARLDAKDVNMHANHEYNCSGFKILTCSP